IDSLTGEPVHILALSGNPAPMSDALKSLVIPAGNQLARLPGGPPLFGTQGAGGGRGQGTSGNGESGNGSGNGGSPDGTSDGTDGGGVPVHSLLSVANILGMLKTPGLS